MRIEHAATRTTVHIADACIALEWYGEAIVRVRAWRGDTEPVQACDEAVIASPKALAGVSVEEAPEGICLKGPSFDTHVGPAGDVRFVDKHGAVILGEEPGGRRFGALDAPGCEESMGVGQRFSLSPAEALYGLGQFQDGVLNRRGHRASLIQGNQIAVVPFLLSSAGWGVLWNSAARTEFDDSSNGMLLWSAAGSAVDYFFCYGPSPDGVIQGYRALTGDAPLLPRWAYGYWQSKERYRTADELADTVCEFRQRDIPLDVIVQDWLYWGGDSQLTASGMTYDAESFGDLPGAIRTAHEQNTRVVISIWPILGNETALHKELAAAGHMFKRSHAFGKCYDAFSADARAIYWKHARDGLWRLGVDGWWMDATEPEFMLNLDPTQAHQALLAEGTTAAGPWAELLNAFVLHTARGVYEGQRADTEERRVAILTRSAFTGSQRYAAITWSGDIPASWSVFRNQIVAGLNLCMAGIPYWTSDAGAFFVRILGGQFPEGVDDPAYRELFLRWMQYAVFCPVMRAHGTETPREPWSFGDAGDVIYEGLLGAIRLRYRLLPTLYSLAHRVTHEGYTLMRGLAMDFPGDARARDCGDQFMVGSSLLVCPVTHPVEAFPSGAVPDTVWLSAVTDRDGQPGALTTEYYIGDSDRPDVVQRTHILDITRHVLKHANVPAPKRVVLEGTLRLPSPDIKTMVLCAAGPVKMWLDGKLVLDASGGADVVRHRVALPAPDGEPLAIRLDHHVAAESISLRVGWEWCGDTAAAVEENRTRPVYLPEGGWVDFWTGEPVSAGTHAWPARLDRIPLFVRAGSILPLGPAKSWADEDVDQPIELRIYPGRDAEFTLYDDAGDGYGYERGEYAAVSLHWVDARGHLRFSARRGTFPGLRNRQIFYVTLVRPGRGMGAEPEATPDKVVEYTGAAMTVALADETTGQGDV